MAFQQLKLDKSTHQARGIFDKYIYKPANGDTEADICAPGYFSESRFLNEPDWVGSIIEIEAADGFTICRILDGGSVEMLINSSAGDEIDASSIKDLAQAVVDDAAASGVVIVPAVVSGGLIGHGNFATSGNLPDAWDITGFSVLRGGPAPFNNSTNRITLSRGFYMVTFSFHSPDTGGYRPRVWYDDFLDVSIHGGTTSNNDGSTRYPKVLVEIKNDTGDIKFFHDSGSSDPISLWSCGFHIVQV